MLPVALATIGATIGRSHAAVIDGRLVSWKYMLFGTIGEFCCISRIAESLAWTYMTKGKYKHEKRDRKTSTNHNAQA